MRMSFLVVVILSLPVTIVADSVDVLRGWTRSELALKEQIWIQEQSRKVLIVQDLGRIKRLSSVRDVRSLGPQFVKDRSRILSIFGISDWHMEEFSAHKEKYGTKLLVRGTYRDLAGRPSQFMELFLFAAPTTVHVSYHELGTTVTASDLVKETMDRLALEKLGRRAPASMNDPEQSSDATEEKIRGCHENRQISDLDRLRLALTHQTFDDLCKDVPWSDRIKSPAEYTGFKGYFLELYDQGMFAAGIGCVQSVLKLIKDAFLLITAVIAEPIRLVANEEHRALLIATFTTLIAEAQKDPVLFFTKALSFLKEKIGEVWNEFLFCYNQRKQTEVLCELVAGYLTGEMLLSFIFKSKGMPVFLEKIMHYRADKLEKMAVKTEALGGALTSAEIAQLRSEAAKILSSNLSDGDKIMSVSRLYVEKRIAKLPPKQQEEAHRILSNVKAGEESHFIQETKQIEIDMKSTQEMLRYHSALAHELEHAAKYLSVENMNVLQRSLRILLGRHISPKMKLIDEIECVGAEWDLIQVFPKSFVEKQIATNTVSDMDFIKHFSGVTNGILESSKTRLRAGIHLSRSQYINHVRSDLSGYHGLWAAEREIAEFQKDVIFMLQTLTLALVLEGYRQGVNE